MTTGNAKNRGTGRQFKVASKAATKTPRKTREPRVFPVSENQVLPSIMAAARRYSNDDPARRRVISVSKVEVLSIPWNQHPGGARKVN